MSRLSDGDKKLLGNLSALGVIADSAPVRRSLDSAVSSPIQSSRSEIVARLKGKRPSVASNSSHGSEPKATSLHRTDSTNSPSSPRKYSIFGRGDRDKKPSPIEIGSNSPLSATTNLLDPTLQSSKEGIEAESTLPAGFGESPRRAPPPPTRPERPTNEPLLYSTRASFPSPQNPIPELPTPNGNPPPIPPKSAARHRVVGRTTLAQPPLISTDSSISSIHSESSINNSGANVVDDHLRKQYISGAPPTSVAQESNMSKMTTNINHRKRKSVTSIAGASSNSHSILSPGDRAALPLSGVKSAKINRSIRTKLNASAHISLKSQSLTGHPFAYNNDNPNANVQVDVLNRMAMLDKALPDTPTRISGTPVEMYHGSKGLRQVTKQKRDPLAPIPTTHEKSNSAQAPVDHASPSGLSAILEYSAASENASSRTQASNQTTAQMHLREGSVVTVSPPELTAWQRTVFIQGPIKLPKQAVLPRRDSVASLEAFQDAIDHVYQDALYIPRRMSDEFALDGVVQFFQGFGLADICFGSDTVSKDLQINNAAVAAVCENVAHEVERFSTPPAEPEASLIERVVAKEVVQSMARPMPLSSLYDPPIGREDELHAAGVARQIAKGSANGHLPALHQRGDSVTLPRFGAGSLPLGRGMLDTDPEPQMGSDAEMIGDQGFDWDDDVEEMDGSSSWLASRKYGFRGVDSRNPMRKVRRLVSTSTAIL